MAKTPAEDESPDKDQSMDDILASIRRIMLDEQARLSETGAAGHSARTGEGFVLPAIPAESAAESAPVLVLDDSMAVQPAAVQPVLLQPTPLLAAPVVRMQPGGPEPAAVPETESHADARPIIQVLPEEASAIDHALPVSQEAHPMAEETLSGAVVSTPVINGITAQALEEMLAPAAAAAAAASVDALLHKLQQERQALLQPASSSPSLEEFVRAELRPLLKTWLDEHLPTMVERLVRAELARLTLRHGV
jgi:cell pole-organizing protein PopZ